MVFEVKYFKYTLFVYILLPPQAAAAPGRKLTLEFYPRREGSCSPVKKMLTGNGGISFAVSSFLSGSTLFQLAPRSNRQGKGPDFPARPRREKRGAQGHHLDLAAAFRMAGGWRLHGQTSGNALDFRREICVRPAPPYLFGSERD